MEQRGSRPQAVQTHTAWPTYMLGEDRPSSERGLDKPASTFTAGSEANLEISDKTDLSDDSTTLVTKIYSSRLKRSFPVCINAQPTATKPELKNLNSRRWYIYIKIWSIDFDILKTNRFTKTKARWKIWIENVAWLETTNNAIQEMLSKTLGMTCYKNNKEFTNIKNIKPISRNSGPSSIYLTNSKFQPFFYRV